eukprot:10557620-Lingulodinium_polyedra.AAC.1
MVSDVTESIFAKKEAAKVAQLGRRQPNAQADVAGGGGLGPRPKQKRRKTKPVPGDSQRREIEEVVSASKARPSTRV